MRSTGTVATSRPRHGSILFRSVVASLVLIYSALLSSNGLGQHSTGLVSALPVVDHPSLVHSKRQDTRQDEKPPVPQDPCAILGPLLEPAITYTHVKRCYENIPYNETEANIILSTIYTLFKDYFIFLDSATNEHLPKPFTTPPVDILKGLDRISKQTYRGDFRFHTDVETLVSGLNDAHSNYLRKYLHCSRQLYKDENPGL